MRQPNCRDLPAAMWVQNFWISLRHDFCKFGLNRMSEFRVSSTLILLHLYYNTRVRIPKRQTYEHDENWWHLQEHAYVPQYQGPTVVRCHNIYFGVVELGLVKVQHQHLQIAYPFHFCPEAAVHQRAKSVERFFCVSRCRFLFYCVVPDELHYLDGNGFITMIVIVTLLTMVRKSE